MKNNLTTSVPERKRQKGKIKFFSYRRGYGFIVPDNKTLGEDIFFHFSSIGNTPGMVVYLIPDEKVEFELIRGPRGYLAKNVISKNKVTNEKNSLNNIDRLSRLIGNGLNLNFNSHQTDSKKICNIYYHYYHSFKKIMNDIVKDEILQIQKGNKKP